MEDKAITISVVIPVYNVSEYVERCLKSVMWQTFQDFECILVDDASTDDSIVRCERLIADYYGLIRFRILHHQHRRGLSAARNTGTEAATGDYILYVDSDDVITDDCIEKLMAPILQDDSIEMVMGNYERFAVVTQLPIQHKKHGCEMLATQEAVRNGFFDRKNIYCMAWNKLTKREFLQTNNLTFKEGVIWEDFLWTFHVMKYLKHLCMIEDVTYLRYLRSDSIVLGTDMNTKLYNWGLIFHEISSDFTPGDSNREARFYTKEFCRQYIHCFHDELYRETAKNFRRELSLIKNPSKYLCLVITDIMARSWIGRQCYCAIGKLHGKIYRLCCH